jgi:predicted nucleic acid-binding protein
LNALFLDTSFLFALAARDDALHSRARELRPSPAERWVTTDFILIELADGLSRGHQRSLALGIIDSLRGNPLVTIHSAAHDLVEAGLALYTSRPDKDWGLTDCISFVIMQREGITQALTADKHFEQAGFTALLK